MKINAVQTTEYENTCMYTFTVDNEKFQVYYIYEENKQSLEFFHNGTSIDKATYEKTVTIDTEKGKVNVTAWINRASSAEKFFGLAKDGVGIEVDGIPVKNTLADPDEYLNQGRSGLGLLLFTLVARGILTHVLNNDLGFALVFYIPALAVLAFLLLYKKCILLALIVGAVLGIIELVDYITTIPSTMTQPGGSSILSISIIGGWLMFRVRMITGFYTAFKWQNEENKIDKLKDINQEQQDKTETNENKSVYTPVVGNTWVCKNCEEVNPATASSCKSCGGYR